MIDSNGVVYVGTQNPSNMFYALYGPTNNAGGFAQDCWPMLMHDRKHSGARHPPQVAFLTASDGAFTDRVATAWSAVTNATTYQVWRGTSSQSSAAAVLAETAATNYNDTAATPGIVYYYWTRAGSYAGLSGFGPSDSGWRASPAPSGVAASDGAFADKVRATWQAVTGALSYRVWSNTADDTNTAALAGITTNILYDDTAAGAGLLRYYWVQASNALDMSAWSAPDSGWQLLAAPSSLMASDGAYTDQVAISWSASTNATAYSLWRGTANDTNVADFIVQTTNTTYADVSAVTGVVNYYWVKATNGLGASDFSAPDTGWRAAPAEDAAPAAPTGVAASDGTFTDKVLITWQPSQNATNYEVWRGTASNQLSMLSGLVTATNYADTTAVAGTIYYYGVKARSAGGTSALSSIDSGWRLSIYTITASAGAHGSISPSGAVSVVQGASQTFTILPEAGYHIAGVVVDGAAAGAVATYTFNAVSASHTIAASFTANQSPVIALAVTPTAGMAPLRVQFDFTGSADPDGSVVKFEVDRTGDGIFEVQSTDMGNFIVEYAEAGAYQTVARITDNDNATAATSVVITVRGVSPVADITAYPESGNAPLIVAFKGTNSSAPAGRALVAYEWDFNGDGVYDRLSRTGAVSWTYREAGTNLATLRVTDNTGVQATDTVVVRVSPSTTPPPVVSLTATPLAGYLPLAVTFTAAIADGRPVTNYYWDFDGDSHYDKRTSVGLVSNVYTVAGTYQARVLVVDASGLAGTNGVTISVSEANTLTVWLSTPRDGSRVSGSSVSLMGHAAPASQLSSAQFQFKPAASNTWENLGAEIVPPPYAYALAWDITGVALGDYDLRLSAVDTNGNTVVADAVRVTVVSGNERQPGDVHEDEQDGLYQKMETFSADETATLAVFDGTMVIMLMGTVDSNVTIVVALTGANTNPVNGAAFGRVNINANRHISIEGNPELQQPVVIIIPYDDDDNDGVIDGTRVRVDSLVMYWYDPAAGEWQRCLTTEVHPDEKYVLGTVYHLTEFGLFGSIKDLPIFGDFDGDRKTDPAVYAQASGTWRVLLSGDEYREVQFILGGTGYLPVPGDYDADQKADPGVYQESQGYWSGYLSGRAYSRLDSTYLGGLGYTFVPADYDGDGKADPAVYNESTGHWLVQVSGSDYTIVSALFGGLSQTPVPGDYDGDGKADPAVYEESSGTWYFLLSGYEYALYSAGFGGPGWTAIPADYDGDGKADPAVYERASGQWYILHSNNGYTPAMITLGGSGYLPVPGDYDGAGAVAPAVYQDSSGIWRVLLPSSDYNEVSTVFGGAGFAPVNVR
ncbi:MAG: hypothetical protein HYV35_01865 [Lentisphaerae bacterium]|nr:hypothetical protein [Lentisphaerota bacterium]